MISQHLLSCGSWVRIPTGSQNTEVVDYHYFNNPNKAPKVFRKRHKKGLFLCKSVAKCCKLFLIVANFVQI